MRCDRLVLALLITACGGAPAGGVDAGVMDAGPDGGVDAGFDAATEVDAAVDETADPEALATAFRERACAKARRCESIFRTDVDAFCHPGYRSHVWEEMLAAWRAGRARYDAEAARACLEAIEAEACSIRAIDPGPPVCLEAVVGTVPEGGVCDRGSSQLEPQCAPGLDCVSEGECPDRCEPRSDAGEPCSGGRRCTGRQLCRDGVCVGDQPPGDACTDLHQRCGPDYICHDGACARQPVAGEPCGADYPQCAWGTYCDADASGADVCRAYGAAEGEPCSRAFESCDYPLVCVELPEPPSPFIEGACTRGAELGEPCDERTPCGPFGRCVEGRCAEIVDPAGQCDALHVCPTTHDCVDGACVPGPLPGEACEGRRCGFTACRDGVCLAHDPGEGEPCWGEGYQCDFGLECGGDPAATTCRPPCP